MAAHEHVRGILTSSGFGAPSEPISGATGAEDDLSISRFWRLIPPPDRKLLMVGVSAMGIGLVVGGTSVYFYRRWTASMQQERVEALSRSLSGVYEELRSLQQGMVRVQESLTQMNRDPLQDGQKRRRPRRLQFYDSDSDDGSVYLSADDEKLEKRQLKPILKKRLSNGHVEVDGVAFHVPAENGDIGSINQGLSIAGMLPASPLASPTSDDDDVYEDALQDGFDEGVRQDLIFEKEFEHMRGDSGQATDTPVRPTPFDAIDMILDASVSNEQVTQALELIKSKQPTFGEDPEYLWRLAKATFIYGNQCLKHDVPSRIALMKEAKQYADAARKLNNSHPDVLKWCALTTGGLARYAETTQKINYGLATRDLLQQALDLRPNDASLHHILGRWNYEISQLGWVERTAVRAIFGKYAQVTVEDAKRCFLEAEKLKPKMFKSNMYYIAKCFAQQGNKSEARKWLTEALSVERLCVEDEQCDVDIQELMVQL
ncbi:regulator of microtubule dynamics protein 3-like [Paramacrobiotus metropolitanus]|uniref:regulator of microtubule dynamics protein 3-like n=1 Tax=Paramacrobiotus metropolitanus TaxID=2943436 RepID=UPI002445771C|nr:regulator of microtubule dynamics protein 3-like [Paramacrobiotus metropolitanus]